MTDESVELGHDSAVALKVATSAVAGFTKEYNELGFAVKDSAELDVHHTKRYEAMVDSLSAAALVEQSMAAVPVLDREGQPTGVYTFNGSTAVRALEILGRHLGMFPTGPAVVVDNRKQELQEFTITFDRADEKDAREVLADRIALMAARAREQDGPEE